MNKPKTEVFEKVEYDASDSYDADGNIQKYEWFFGDGFTALGKKVSHSYQNSGRFMVRLDVTDNDKLLGTKVIPLIVSNSSSSSVEKIEYVRDPSFESKKHNFESYYHKPNISISNSKPINGSSSLNIVFGDWSSIVLPIAYPWQAGPKANNITVSTRLRINSAAANTTIEVCVQTFSFEKNNEIKQETCESLKADKKDIVTLNPSLILDPTKNLSRIYLWINYSHTGTADVSIDDTHFILEAIKGSGGNPE